VVFPAPAPKLFIRRLLGNSYQELIDRDSWTIGRDQTCEIRLEDSWVSRNHAIITRTDDGAFYFEDLGSRNGSLVNGQTATQPVLLQNGDILTLGTIEMEFQHPTASNPRNLTPSPPKTVLITRTSPRQAEIWRVVLGSQGVAVILDQREIDLRQMMADLAVTGQPLPGLLIIDIEVQSSSVYAFCRWCREAFPSQKILLVSASRTEIFPVEQQWAIYQGAQDLLPGFQEPKLLADPLDIVTKVDRVFNAIHWRPFSQKSMVDALLDLQAQLKC
jgi:pSer/pThr/pTyr-binding forkhead associated (FHA) protein